MYSQFRKTWKLGCLNNISWKQLTIWFSTKCVSRFYMIFREIYSSISIQTFHCNGSFFSLFYRRNFVKSTHHLYRYVVFTIFFSCERKVPWFLLCLTSSPTNFAWNFQIHFSHANCTFSRIFCFCCKKHIKDHKKFAQIFFFFVKSTLQ